MRGLLRSWAGALPLLLLCGSSLAQTAGRPAAVPLPAAPPKPPSAETAVPGAAPPGHEHHAHHGAPKRLADAEQARKYFSDVVLVDQHGEPQRLYSDLLSNRVVVINPFFTSCTGVCPVLSQKVAAVQKHFGDRLGQDLRLLSISVDPETDDTEKLAAYAKRFKAGPGWYFLSGKKENVDWALYRLGQYVEDKEAHTNIIIVGNEATGKWRKIFGPGPTENLLQAVQEVLDDQG